MNDYTNYHTDKQRQRGSEKPQLISLVLANMKYISRALMYAGIRGSTLVD